jgi:predicted acylesterase/phospholipase RssA
MTAKPWFKRKNAPQGANGTTHLAGSPKEPQPDKDDAAPFIAPDQLEQGVPAELLEEELKLIGRRRATFTSSTALKAPAGVETRESLVGLALSGGGIRSAAFNLGLLQALFRQGLIRHVDYLSTVSGGGYIGTWFSSLIHSSAARLHTANSGLASNLQSQKGGRQPRAVLALARNGKYLDRMDQVWSRYSIGLFYTNIAILSVLVFVCLLIAYCWRAMDDNVAVYWLYYRLHEYLRRYTATEYRLSEAIRPFLPGLLLLCFWMAAWMFAHRAWLRDGGHRAIAAIAGSLAWVLAVTSLLASAALAFVVVFGSPWLLLFLGPPALIGTGYLAYRGWFLRGRAQDSAGWSRIADRIFVFAVCALLIGVAVFLANPAINAASFLTMQPATSPAQLTDKTKSLAYPLLGLLFTALVPLLRPQRLLQSGLRPKSIWEQRVFAIATSALLFGVPLALIWLFAHHDFFARQNAERSRKLAIGDIYDLKKFNERLNYQSERGDKIGGFLHCQFKAALQNCTSVADKSRVLEAMNRVGVPIDPEARQAKAQFIEAFNIQVLHNPRFTDLALAAATDGLEKPHKIEDGWFYRTLLSRHARADDIARQLYLAQQKKLDEGQRAELNRLLLEACYPNDIVRQDQIVRTNTIDDDQHGRLRTLGWVFVIVLISGLLVNLNATSMHSFYRDRLAGAFIYAAENKGLPLHELTTAAWGGPYHLYSATLNRKPTEPSPSKLDPQNLGQTRTEDFLLSALYCGSSSKGYQRTRDYLRGELTVADAMAISGAAVSPSQLSNWLVVALMIALNARTGQWLPRPRSEASAPQEDSALARLMQWIGDRFTGVMGPTLISLGLDRLANEWGKRRLYFITDGGHHENLGLWPLLERRCRLIIASDASEDGTSGFADLLRVVRRARFERGIQLKAVTRPAFDSAENDEELANLLELLRSADEPTDEQMQQHAAEGRLSPGYRRSMRHFFLARIDYPDAEPGYLLYVKPTLTGDEEADLQAYAAQNRDFPHHPTPDQLYDEDRFESYRQLGEHIGGVLCKEIHHDGKRLSFWSCASVLPLFLDENSKNEMLKRQNAALQLLVTEKTRRRRRVQRIQNVSVP